jgi:hypothetical protein
MAPILPSASLYYAAGRRVSRCGVARHSSEQQISSMANTPSLNPPSGPDERPPLSCEEAIAELRRLWQEGIDSGMDETSDVESIVAELRQRFLTSRAG